MSSFYIIKKQGVSEISLSCPPDWEPCPTIITQQMVSHMMH